MDFVVKERKRLPRGEKRVGRMMEVTCRDGEVMVASTDSNENTARAFILSKAVNRVRFL